MPNFKSNSRNKVKLGRIIIYTQKFIHKNLNNIPISPLFFFQILRFHRMHLFQTFVLSLSHYLLSSSIPALQNLCAQETTTTISLTLSFPFPVSFIRNIYIPISHIFLILELTISIFLSLKKKKKKGDETCYSNSRSNLRKTKRLDQLVLIRRKS